MIEHHHIVWIRAIGSSCDLCVMQQALPCTYHTSDIQRDTLLTTFDPHQQPRTVSTLDLSSFISNKFFEG